MGVSRISLVIALSGGVLLAGLVSPALAQQNRTQQNKAEDYTADIERDIVRYGWRESVGQKMDIDDGAVAGTPSTEAGCNKEDLDAQMTYAKQATLSAQLKFLNIAAANPLESAFADFKDKVTGQVYECNNFTAAFEGIGNIFFDPSAYVSQIINGLCRMTKDQLQNLINKQWNQRMAEAFAKNPNGWSWNPANVFFAGMPNAPQLQPLFAAYPTMYTFSAASVPNPQTGKFFNPVITFNGKQVYPKPQKNPSRGGSPLPGGNPPPGGR
ncbi:MAG: hypothetical protein M3O22_03195 [Pseudomonadota bacterium]|nr:hypothetical protein [Pseudomonadota bacterium]